MNINPSIKIKGEHFNQMYGKKTLWVCEKGNELSDDLGKEKTMGVQSDGRMSGLICSLINLSKIGR